MTARAIYTAHVVRGACCTGGRLCSTGRVLLLEAKAEEARTEYEGLVCMVGAYERECRAFCREGHRTKCQLRWLDYDAASLDYDLANAEAAVERTRLGVA